MIFFLLFLIYFTQCDISESIHVAANGILSFLLFFILFFYFIPFNGRVIVLCMCVLHLLIHSSVDGPPFIFVRGQFIIISYKSSVGRGVKFLLISAMIQLKVGLWFCLDFVLFLILILDTKQGKWLRPEINLDPQVG